jgi:phage terminase large subunit-like protein
LQPGSREPVFVGLDLAVKPGGDDAALVGLYEKGDKIAVAFHKLWKGGQHRKTDLRISETVKPAILKAAKLYNMAMVACDPWQAYGLIQDLQRAGLPVVEVPQTHSTRAPADTALHDLARYGDLRLYDHPELVGAAASASAKELGNGLLFVTKTGRGKIDLLVAMSNALLATSVPRYSYELIYNPVQIGPPFGRAGLY